MDRLFKYKKESQKLTGTIHFRKIMYPMILHSIHHTHTLVLTVHEDFA